MMKKQKYSDVMGMMKRLGNSALSRRSSKALEFTLETCLATFCLMSYIR
jgi:hypothetical protein